MKFANKFNVSCQWKILLLDMGLDPEQVLSYAKLPTDLFNRGDASLTPKEYFQLWQGIDKAGGDREVPLLLAKFISTEVFDAPIFASLCSENFNAALLRLQKYKPLIGPMLLSLDFTNNTQLHIECYGNDGLMPYSLGLSEAVFFTQIIRIATRENIVPLSLSVPQLPRNTQAYEDYFGCQLSASEQVNLTFSSADAEKPFLTSNAEMWSFFEDKLNQRLADLTASASTTERVRSVLLEALPSGTASIESVAKKLAMSKRTLQRKLTAEAESFQSILLDVRSELARHYLVKSEIPLIEISFLLGFKEPNSFIRAFSEWQGVSPGHFREQYRPH